MKRAEAWAETSEWEAAGQRPHNVPLVFTPQFKKKQKTKRTIWLVLLEQPPAALPVPSSTADIRLQYTH